MPISMPERSLQQRMDALGQANKIRTRRAGFKLDVKAGRVLVHDYILDPPDWMDTMQIIDLLMAMPKYGISKVNRLLKLARVSSSKTLGGMSARQRLDLVAYLR